jgi:hypothetical protein
MIASALAARPEALPEAREAARAALQARRALWDGTLALLQEQREPPADLSARSRPTPVAA